MKKIILSLLSIFLFAGASNMRAENIGVPSECEDVMLQAFYWDSYKTKSGSNSKYGRTKWLDLQKDSVELRENFDLIWLPPCSYADGGNGKGGVGYTPKQLNNMDSDWGTLPDLKKLITALHRGGTKVVADIVINHRGNNNTWCNFFKDNFGDYGSFQLTQSHICKYDEGFTDSSSSCYNSTDRGAADSGTNFGGARDLDHTNEYVQSWAKAYLQWMLNTMTFDGFRYDMTLGYNGKYLSMYNEAAQPYFSVSEYWESMANQKNHLTETKYNTMVFDFQLKYELHKAIVQNMYSKLKVTNTNTLRGNGLEKYAVTFIDNHDTFERSEEDACKQEFSGCNADLSSALVKNRILQANAYILMMPGVPCVFYPHWATYKEVIRQLISIRKQAGIHSESKVTNETGTTSSMAYSGTIQGHKRNVVLRLGSKRSKEAPEGYSLAYEGGSDTDVTIFISDNTQGVENVESAKGKGVKFLDDGKLFIRFGNDVYDVLGNKIQ